MAFRRSFDEYISAQGIAPGSLQAQSPLPLAVLSPPAPPPTPPGGDPTRLLSLLGVPPPAAPLPAAPGAPAVIAPGGSPTQRFGGEVEAMRQGMHDPTASGAEQALRSAATAAQLPLMAADIPRQQAVTNDAEAFIQDIARDNEWSVIMTVMNNLGGLNAPMGIMQTRGDLERSIVPDTYAPNNQIPGFQQGTVEQLSAQYADFMRHQSPEIQRQVWENFLKWHDAKRQEAYTPEGDLKHALTFEQWQALNYDTALNVYINGWQKPAAPIQQPDGTMAAPTVNDNPRFTGGQAVWEAYVNELDPLQRLGQDILHDPTVLIGGVGKGVIRGAGALAERAPTAARALGGVGTLAEAAGDLVPGSRFIPPVADRGVARAIGRAAAGAPGIGRVVTGTDTGVRAAARGFERVMRGIGARPDTIWEEHYEPQDIFASEAFATAQNRPARTAADDAARVAARAQQLRVVVPKPGASWGARGKAADDVFAIYPDKNHPDVRVAERTVQDGATTTDTRNVEVWNTETGAWDTVASHPIGGETSKTRATTAALRDARGVIDQRDLVEVGAERGGPARAHEVTWTGEEIHDLLAITNDQRIVQSGDVVGQDLADLQTKILHSFEDEGPLENSPNVTRSLVLTDDELDTVRAAITAAGGRTMTPVTPPNFGQPIRALTEGAIPLGPGRGIEQPPLPMPPAGTGIEPPLPPRRPPIEQATLPAAPEAPAPPAPIEPRGGAGTAPVAVAPPPDVAPTAVNPPPSVVETPPETTPATIRLGRSLEGALDDKGIGAVAYNRLQAVAKSEGDDDLADALSRFKKFGGERAGTYHGELTADQARRLVDLSAGPARLPDSAEIRKTTGYQGNTINRELSRLSGTLTPEITPAEVLPPTPVVTPPPVPETRRTVGLTTNVRNKALASDAIPEEVKARLRGAPTRKRGVGEVLDVPLSQSELDQLNTLTGPNVKRDMRRATSDFSNAPEAPAPDLTPAAVDQGMGDLLPPVPVAEVPEVPASARPPFPTRPQGTLAETAARLQAERGLTPSAAADLEDLGPIVPRDQQHGDVVPQIPRTSGMTGPITPGPSPSAEFPEAAQAELPVTVTPPEPGPRPFARGQTPVQRVRDTMLRQQYPDRPIAYKRPDGLFQLLNEDVPIASQETARFSAQGAPVPSFTGTREEILANVSEPDKVVFVDPANDFRALDAGNALVPPPAGGRDYSAGIRGDLDPQRADTAAPIDEAGVEQVLTPFREALSRAAGDNGVARGVIEDELDATKEVYLGQTEGGFLAGRDTAVNHEIKGALTLARGIIGAMEAGLEDIPGWQGRFEEIGYVGNPQARGMRDDPRGDFDWVMRAVFGSSRASKQGTKGFEAADAAMRLGSDTSAGGVQKAIQQRIADLSAQGAVRPDRAAEADQLRSLMTEIDELRRRYIDLIGKQTGSSYYAGIPGGEGIANRITQGMRAVADPLVEAARGAPQPPTPETYRNAPRDAQLIDLLSADAKAASQVQWVDHPEFKGQDSFTVLDEINYQARTDQAEFKALLDQGVTVPEPTMRRQGLRRVPTKPKMTPDEARMDELQRKYRYSMPLGKTLDTVDPATLAHTTFLREFLVEKGAIKPHEGPTSWLGELGRWLVGMHRDAMSMSAQLALHDPMNFRYVAMNHYGNSFLMALKYPRVALRGFASPGFRSAYAEATEGTFSPVAKIMRFQKVRTGPEIFAARMGMTVPREVGKNEQFAHERSSRGVRDFLNRIGAGKAGAVARPFENTANLHITIEGNQREAHWQARAEERVAEAWADTRGLVGADLAAAGLGDTAITDIERRLHRNFGSYELYDEVYRVANGAGKSPEEAAAIARQAYDRWATPSRRAARQAVADLSGPMVLNRRTPLDDKLGLIVPFSFWNMRTSKFLLGELYGSPARMAAFERYQDWADNYQRDHPELPGFIRGYMHLTATPFGSFLAVNPASLLLTQAFMDDHVRQTGFDRTAWDEITDAIGGATGWSPMPDIRFFAQALGYSRDKYVRLPIIMPDTIKTFGAMIDYLSALSGGEGGIPLNQLFWTWASTQINEIAAAHLPGAELVGLTDPMLARQSPVHAIFFEDHPELVKAATDAQAAGDDEGYQAAVDQIVAIMDDDDHPFMRDAWTKAAGAKLFTQTFNDVSPLLGRSVNPAASSLSSAISQEVVTNDLQNQAIADVESAASGLPATVPLGTNTTSPLAQPVGVADWRTDPRWANHLTGGPAPDVQNADKADMLYLVNDLSGSTPEFRRIAAVETQYHNIGNPEERQTYADWNAIAYGTPMRTVDMGAGRVYSPADVLALPEEQRKMLADEWVMTHATLSGKPLVPLLESYRMQRDQFAAANPEWAAYDTWRDKIRGAVELGTHPNLVEWGRQEAARNPNFKRHFDDVMYRLETGEYDQERAESKMLSVDAYLADQNIQQNVTDAAIIPAAAASGGGSGTGGLTQEDIIQAVLIANNSGSAFNPAEAIRQDMQAYSRDLMTTNTFMSAIGLTNIQWETAPTRLKQMMIPLMNDYDIPMPELSRDTQAYLEWAQTHPGGTPEQFLLDRQQRQIQVMTGGLPTQPTLASP